MHRTFALSLFTAFMMCGCSSGSVEQTEASPRDAPLKKEVYAIYNEALKHYAMSEHAHTVSIVRYTTLDHMTEKCLKESDDSQQWQSAVADLLRKNTSPSTLEPKFDVPFTYDLADELERVGGVRPAPPGMSRDEFLQQQIAKLQQRANEHFTQVQLSVPGISDDGQVSVVYIAISFAGDFYILHKNGGKWNMEPKPVCSWIS